MTRIEKLIQETLREDAEEIAKTVDLGPVRERVLAQLAEQKKTGCTQPEKE